MELTVIKGGLNRLRTKGAAPNDSLFDLLNGYVTVAKTVQVRPGTFRYADLGTLDSTLDNPTKGLVAFDGELHVFSALAIADADIPAGFKLHVISHPSRENTDGSIIQVKKIHFAKPFMGFLYVVAEFEPSDYSDTVGDIFHYWLQSGDVWEANKIYKLGDIIVPSVPNGFAYQATRLTPANQSWAPNVQRAIGDVIEPTVYNDFYYTVVDTLGDNPRSGTEEPVWPTEDGQQIFEDVNGDAGNGGSTTPQPDTSSTPNPTTSDRYDPDLLPGS